MPYLKYTIILACCLLNLQLGAQDIRTDNLILYFNFDNSQLKDESLLRQSFIDHNLEFNEGINDTGLLMNGTNAFLEIPYSTKLKVENNVTTSVWYKHGEQETGAFYSLVEQSADENGGHSRYGSWVFDKHKLMTCVEPDSCPDGSPLCQRCTTASGLLEVGKWYHIVSMYTGNSLQIYVNGEQLANRTFDESTGISTRPYPLTIGTDMYDISPVYLNGILDELRIYNSQLDNNQIEALFREFTIVTSLKDIELLPFSVFPNPANQYLEIQSNYPNGHYVIHNTLGQTVATGELPNNSIVNVKHLESGMYYLKYTDGLRVSSKAIVINR